MRGLLELVMWVCVVLGFVVVKRMVLLVLVRGRFFPQGRFAEIVLMRIATVWRTIIAMKLVLWVSRVLVTAGLK
jgi:hypothetical protein